MKYEPLISVGMPVYNAAAYLPEAIEGVLNQTYPRVELVICDNCSTDESPQIAMQYAQAHRNVRFIQNKWNIGFAGNAFKATSLCQGDFILMHAADDYLVPNAFERYVELVQGDAGDPSSLVLMSDFLRGDARGNPTDRLSLAGDCRSLLSIPASKSVDLPVVARINGHELLGERFPKLLSFGGVGSVLVSRSLYERVEGYQSNHWFNPDKFFLYKILSLNPGILWLREPLYYYRIHESNQLGKQKSTAVLKQLLDEYAYTFEFDKGFYDRFVGGSDKVIRQFVESDCLNAALRELAIGSRTLGFRHLCFALATYPDVAWRNSKTFAAFLVWLAGPIGRFFSGLIYRSGFWKRWQSQSGPGGHDNR